MLKIKNTLTKQLEGFKPISADEVKIYHCGPTVYSKQHTGNLRAAVLGDLIRRSLIFLGYEVKYVRNITDVGHLTSDGDEGEDKMSKGVKAEGLTPQEIAAKYTNIYHEDLNALNVMPPTAEPTASSYVHAMIEMVQELITKGFAYVTPTAVYFDVSKAKDYTRLSGQKLDLNKLGAGHAEVDDQENKRTPYDFALWFFKTGNHANALQVWTSPFQSPLVEEGLGLPGWHIECSAMIKDILGDTIDLHLGGVEHIPVHHTNEIAQSESANDAPFVNYWLHNEHLQVDGGKMAKSDGTVVYLSDIVEKDLPALALRYFFLQSHYRSKQNFTWEAVEAANSALTRLKQQVANLLKEQPQGYEPLPAAVDTEYNLKFRVALEDDFNIPAALAVAWDLLKDSSLGSEAKLATILGFDQVLGLKLGDLEDPDSVEVPMEVLELLEARKAAREAKNWQESDELREKMLADYGFIVKDTDAGQELQKA